MDKCGEAKRRYVLEGATVLIARVILQNKMMRKEALVRAWEELFLPTLRKEARKPDSNLHHI